MSFTIETSTATVHSLTDSWTAAYALLEPALEQNTQTTQDLEQFRGSMAGLVGEFRAWRRDIDGTDSLSLLLTQQNGARILEIWTWERESRVAVQDFMGTVVEASNTAKGIAGGSDRGTYTTRAGDTLQAWPRILAANPGLLPGALAPGQTLLIPEKR